MKIYKKAQFLVFEREDGKQCKYNFATKETIGFKGLPVVKLDSQLSGLSITQALQNFEDKNYADFFRFVYRNKAQNSALLSRFSTLIEATKQYAYLEQYFASGLGNNIDSSSFSLPMDKIPKSLIKNIRNTNAKLTNEIVNVYNKYADNLNWALREEFLALTPKDIFDVMLVSRGWKDKVYNTDRLIKDYNYPFKHLLHYIDKIYAREAIAPTKIINELLDQVNMLVQISPKYEKYPKNFLTTHAIVSRNYNRLRQIFDEKKFKEIIKPEFEKTIDDYIFIYPKTTQEIKDEAVSLNHCVASYIGGVLEGTRDIMFMRKKEMPDKSLITIELVNGRIKQIAGYGNRDLSQKEKDISKKWENFILKNKIKKVVDKTLKVC